MPDIVSVSACADLTLPPGAGLCIDTIHGSVFLVIFLLSRAVCPLIMMYAFVLELEVFVILLSNTLVHQLYRATSVNNFNKAIIFISFTNNGKKG